jgi:hypothetical protein
MMANFRRRAGMCTRENAPISLYCDTADHPHTELAKGRMPYCILYSARATLLEVFQANKEVHNEGFLRVQGRERSQERMNNNSVFHRKITRRSS